MKLKIILEDTRPCKGEVTLNFVIQQIFKKCQHKHDWRCCTDGYLLLNNGSDLRILSNSTCIRDVQKWPS